jgi:hypothetical protein
MPLLLFVVICSGLFKIYRVVMRMLYVSDEFVSMKQATSCSLCSCGKLIPEVEKMPFQLLIFFFQKLCVDLCVLICIVIYLFTVR